MSEHGDSRPPDPPGQDSPERVYPPHEVQARLEVSASGLRRLAGIYERTVGALPRDERGRVWPEDAVEALEDARTMVRESRAVSVEAALRGQELQPGTELHPATQRPAQDATSPGAAILEELRALRRVIEEQNARIAELEEAVRIGGPDELQAPSEPTTTETAPAGDPTPGRPDPLPDSGQDQDDTNLWRRVLAWFGFGVR